MSNNTYIDEAQFRAGFFFYNIIKINMLRSKD